MENTKTMKILNIISKVIIVVTYLLSGILTFFILKNSTEEEIDYLGGVLILIGVIETIVYFTTTKNKEIYCHQLIASVGEVCLGMLFLFSPEHLLTLDNACFMWGILELIKCAFEIYEIVREFRHKKAHMIIDIILASISLVFACLLIIHLGNGVRTHLIVTSIMLLTYSVTYFIRLFIIKTE